MSHPICIDKEAKEQVDEVLCDPALRPRPHINECNTHMCPPLSVSSHSTHLNRCELRIKEIFALQLDYRVVEFVFKAMWFWKAVQRRILRSGCG